MERLDAERLKVGTWVEDEIIKHFDSKLYAEVEGARFRRDNFLITVLDKRKKFLDEIMRTKPTLTREIVNMWTDSVLALPPEERPGEIENLRKSLRDQTQELPAIKRSIPGSL